VNAVLRKLSAVSQKHESLRPDEILPPEALASLSHPPWLVERWIRDYGLATAREICKHNQSVPETAIRLRTSTAATALRQEGISLLPGVLLGSARRVAAGAITETHAFRTGQVVIQDEASQLVATLVAGGPSEKTLRILDCCAAPGGKTLALADRNPGAAITALELHPHRARLLRKLLRRSHAGKQIQILVGDARNLPPSSRFNLVLTDVPCSGTGTLARNPEIKWRLGPDDLNDLQARQIAILRSALAQVVPGGRLIYSTCSLEREENEDVIERVLAENHSFRLLDCRIELDRLKAAGELVWPDPALLTRGPYLRTIPGVHPCDGFFAAILERA